MTVKRMRAVGPKAVDLWVGHGGFTPGSAVTVLIIVGDGPVVILLEAVGVATAPVGKRILGINFDCLVVVGDGPVVVVLGLVGVATVVVAKARFFVGSLPDWISVLQLPI